MAVVIDGDTGVSKVQDGVVVQADLASGVAGTGPAFLAYAASQTLTGSVVTKITANSEQFDTNNCFDPTTNYRFTPNVAGYYQFNAVIRTNNGGAGEFVAIIQKNGSSVAQGNNNATTTVSITGVQVACLVYLNGTTDYVELCVYTSNGCTTIGGSQTQISGFLARAA